MFKHVLGRPEGVAWLAGGFMMVGYLVHLVLDEIYSVDVMDVRVKSSFGTAVKLIDRRYPFASGAMVLATAAAFYLTPPSATFVDGISSRSLWAGLNHRLLPQGRWFGVIGGGRGLADATSPTMDHPASAITTGSLPASIPVSDQPAPTSAPATKP